MNYAQYIETVLYAPEVGYYTRPRQRVGRMAKADFYTAESLGPVFAELVVHAALGLLDGKQAAAEHQFVEIAAEPNHSLITHLGKPHPFHSAQTVRLGTELTIQGPSVVFANEWLDALPFHRLVFVKDQWRERGVYLDGEDLKECLLPELSGAVQAEADRLPLTAEEGYQLDWPLAAEAALADLLAQPWTGALILFDYGKSWAALTHDLPGGTARTYHRHTADNDLLTGPGERDITCDVCWDPLMQIAQTAGFHGVSLLRQEAFFIEKSGTALQRIVENAAGDFSRARQTVFELIHPGNMGHRFQVLSGSRPKPSMGTA